MGGDEGLPRHPKPPSCYTVAERAMTAPTPPRTTLGAALLLTCSGMACTPLVGRSAPSDGPADAALDLSPDAALDAGPPVCPPSRGVPGASDPRLFREIAAPPRQDFFLRGAMTDREGRIYAWGTTRECPRPTLCGDGTLVRLTPEGELDASFGEGGVAYLRNGGELVTDYVFFGMDLDPQGRAVLVGFYWPTPGVTRAAPLVARFTAQGRPDESFGEGGVLRPGYGIEPGVPGASLYGVVAEADGIVAVGGDAEPFRSSTLGLIVRLRNDGVPDERFNGGRPRFDPTSSAYSAVVAARGGYAAATMARDGLRPRVALFSREGAPVGGFGEGGVATHGLRDLGVRSLAVDARGGFVVGGSDALGGRYNLVRFDRDGAPDLAFGRGGLASTPVVMNYAYTHYPTLARQCDGRLLVAGARGAGHAVVRLTPDGQLDTSFGRDGLAEIPAAATRGESDLPYAVLVRPGEALATAVTWPTRGGLGLWRFFL